MILFEITSVTRSFPQKCLESGRTFFFPDAHLYGPMSKGTRIKGPTVLLRSILTLHIPPWETGCYQNCAQRCLGRSWWTPSSCPGSSPGHRWLSEMGLNGRTELEHGTLGRTEAQVNSLYLTLWFLSLAVARGAWWGLFQCKQGKKGFN